MRKQENSKPEEILTGLALASSKMCYDNVILRYSEGKFYDIWKVT